MVDLRKQLIKDIAFSPMTSEDENCGSEREGAEEKGNSKTRKKKKQQIMLDEDDLRHAVANNEKDKEAIYEKLVDIGSIPSEDELSKLII
ncbi:hypothetical protein D3C77_717370 [compost metagenome]